MAPPRFTGPKGSQVKGKKPKKGKKPQRRPGEVFVKNGVTYVVALNGQAYPLPAAPPLNAPPPPGYGKTSEGELVYLGGEKAWYMVGGQWTQQGTETAAPDTDSGIDWAAYFGAWGLPADVIAEVDRIFRSTDNPELASIRALAYIRGTPWYAATYPGITEGMKKGVVRDEADYRQQLTAANFMARQYLGRDISMDEFAANLREGITPEIYGKRLGGAAYVKAYRDDIQYAAGNFGPGELTEEQLKAFGEQSMGLGSTEGGLIEKRLADAQQRIRRVFEGVLASPALSLTGGKLSSGGGTPPDVGV